MHAEMRSLDADAIASLVLGVIWASVYLSSQLIRNAQKDESDRLSSSPFYGLTLEIVRTLISSLQFPST